MLLKNIFFLIILISSLPHLIAAEDEATVKSLFENYVESLKSSDLKKLMSLMDEKFIEASGGQTHWQEIIKVTPTRLIGAKVTTVDYKKTTKGHFARFNMDVPGLTHKEMTDDWYQLVYSDGKFLFHQFLEDYDPSNPSGE